MCVHVLLLLTSALEGVEWSPSHLAALFLGEEYCLPIEQEAGPYIQSGYFGKEKNLSPCQESNPFMVESNRNVPHRHVCYHNWNTGKHIFNFKFLKSDVNSGYPT